MVISTRHLKNSNTILPRVVLARCACESQVLARYCSGSDAARRNNVAMCSVNHCTRGLIASVAGLRFRYQVDSDDLLRKAQVSSW